VDFIDNLYGVCWDIKQYIIFYTEKKIVRSSCSQVVLHALPIQLSVYNSQSMLLIVRSAKLLIRRLQLLFVSQYTNNKILYIILIL